MSPTRATKPSAVAAGVEPDRVQRRASVVQGVGDVPPRLEEGDVELDAKVVVARCHVGE